MAENRIEGSAVSSSMKSVESSTIKMIFNYTRNKNTPFFLKLLYAAFFL